MTRRAKILFTMMICPRCGFSQPEDKFCANCGLNIANYLAKPRPFHQRLLSSSVFYVVLIIVGLFLAINFIRHSNFGQVVRDTFPLGNTPPVAVTNLEANIPTPPPPGGTQNLTNETQPLQNSEPLPTNDASTAATGTVAPAEAAATAGETATVNTDGTVKLNLGSVEASFYLMARDTWQALQQDSKVIAEQGSVRVRQVNNTERVQGLLSMAKKQLFSRPIDGQESAMTHMNFPLGGTPERPTGLFVDFNVQEKDASQMLFDFSIDFNAPEDVQDSRPLVINLRLTAGTILLLNQFLPRKGLPESAQAAAAGTPLEALTMPEYIEGSDELFLAITGGN